MRGGPSARRRRGGRIARHKLLLLSTSAALALVCVQFAVIRLSPAALPVRVAVPATLAGVPLALWPHRGRIGVWVIFVGLAANLVVVVANGGLMPIERSSVEAAVGPPRAAAYAPGEWIPGSKDVLVEPGDGRLRALGDGIVIGAGARGIVASAGDVVIASGLLVLGAEAAVGAQRSRRRDERAKMEERVGQAG